MVTLGPMAPGAPNPVILFDAACVLCSANASFILTHDHRHSDRRFGRRETCWVAPAEYRSRVL